MKIKIKEKELTDPKQNIEIGTLYYSDLLKKYNGNMLLALAAYKVSKSIFHLFDNDGTPVVNLHGLSTNFSTASSKFILL